MELGEEREDKLGPTKGGQRQWSRGARHFL